MYSHLLLCTGAAYSSWSCCPEQSVHISPNLPLHIDTTRATELIGHNPSFHLTLVCPLLSVHTDRQEWGSTSEPFCSEALMLNSEGLGSLRWAKAMDMLYYQVMKDIREVTVVLVQCRTTHKTRSWLLNMWASLLVILYIQKGWQLWTTTVKWLVP